MSALGEPANTSLPSPGSACHAPAAFPVRPELIVAIARTWVVSAACFFAFDVWRTTRVGLTDGIDRPLGWDFINYWSGAAVVLAGEGPRVYEWHFFHAFESAVAGGPIDFFHYGYAPFFLALSTPLALIPYVPAFGVWLAGTWYGFYRALKLALPQGALLLALATPAVFVNAVGGQNGALTAALFGGALCLLDRRPIVAGMLLGLMTYKPHLGVLIPFALLAGRRWTVIGSAIVTVAALVAGSIALFGVEPWFDYARNLGVLRAAVLEDGTGVWHRFVSVFVAARQLTHSVTAAYATQLGMFAIVACVTALAWWRDAPARLRNALLISGTMLATPYIQDYDMVVGAFVAAWLVLHAREDAPRHEAAAMWTAMLVLVLPCLNSLLAKQTDYLWAPLFILPAFVLAARMAILPAAELKPAQPAFP